MKSSPERESLRRARGRGRRARARGRHRHRRGSVPRRQGHGRSRRLRERLSEVRGEPSSLERHRNDALSRRLLRAHRASRARVGRVSGGGVRRGARARPAGARREEPRGAPRSATAAAAHRRPRGEPSAGAARRRDGVAVGEASWGVALPVDPGAHAVAVSAPGKTTWRATVEGAVEATTVSVTVPALADAAPATSDLAPPGASEAHHGNGNGQRVLGAALVGLAVVGVEVGSYFGLRSKAKMDDSTGHCRTTRRVPRVRLAHARGRVVRVDDAPAVDRVLHDERRGVRGGQSVRARARRVVVGLDVGAVAEEIGVVLARVGKARRRRAPNCG